MTNQDFESDPAAKDLAEPSAPVDPSVPEGLLDFDEQDRQAQLRAAALEIVYGKPKPDESASPEPTADPSSQREAQPPVETSSLKEEVVAAKALAKVTKPKAKPRTPTIAELRDLRQIYGKIISVGRLMIPEADLRNDNLASKLVRIINQADLNQLTRSSLQGHEIIPTELRISAKGKTYAHKEPFALDDYTRRIVNQLLITYLDKQLELKTLYGLCGFDTAEGSAGQDEGLQALHHALVYLKHKKIVAYQGGLVSLYPTIIKDERVTAV